MTTAERAARAKALQNGINHLDSLIGTDELPGLAIELQAMAKKLQLQRELNTLLDMPLDHGCKELMQQIDALLPFIK